MESEPLNRWALVLLLLLALLLTAWVVWRQYQLPAKGYQPPVTLPARQDGAITTPVATLGATDSGANSGAAVKRASNEQRTPVESYQQADADSTANVSVADRPKAQSAGAGSQETQARPAKKPSRKARVADKKPAPISYWELPDAVRADVPEIRFSVLVYASEPADRFVLVEGQRLHEGDSYQQGLDVEEIRRDGVVFSYRLYQFLVER